MRSSLAWNFQPGHLLACMQPYVLRNYQLWDTQCGFADASSGQSTWATYNIISKSSLLKFCMLHSLFKYYWCVPCLLIVLVIEVTLSGRYAFKTSGHLWSSNIENWHLLTAIGIAHETKGKSEFAFVLATHLSCCKATVRRHKCKQCSLIKVPSISL